MWFLVYSTRFIRLLFYIDIDHKTILNESDETSVLSCHHICLFTFFLNMTDIHFVTWQTFMSNLSIKSRVIDLGILKDRLTISVLNWFLHKMNHINWILQIFINGLHSPYVFPTSCKYATFSLSSRNMLNLIGFFYILLLLCNMTNQKTYWKLK